MENNITILAGASGGIGRSVVRKFLENGDKVILLDIQKINDEKILSNKNFIYIKTDVTDISQVEKAKKVIEEKYSYIDNIISMAGKTMKSEIGGMDTITIEDIDKSIRLNLNSHIYLTKIFLELLKKSKNFQKTITMISSINAIADYGLPAYSAGKAGIYGFMKAIARQMGRIGIRVNTISLGTVPHNNEQIENNEYFEDKLKTIAMRQFIRPNDVAEMIYSLIYITKGIDGQNIILDMGQSI